MGNVDIRRSSLASPDAIQLVAALNAELITTFPEPGATHFSLSLSLSLSRARAQLSDGDGAFLIAYVNGVAVGCGAIRRLDKTTAELKRMFVAPSLRGQGVGRAIVVALEQEARGPGVSHVVLETGTRLDRAIALYEGMGYSRIPLFGEYLASPNTSLCFGKAL